MSMVRPTSDGVEALALLQQDDELLEQAAHPFGVVALDGDLVAPDHDADVVERLFDQAQQLVSLAEQTHHEVVAGNEDLDLGACHVRSGPTLPAGGDGIMAWCAAG